MEIYQYGGGEHSFFLNTLTIFLNCDQEEDMKKETILRKKQQRALRREQLHGKEEEEKTLLLEEKLNKKRKDRERRRIRKKQLSQKLEEMESIEEAASESESAEESSPFENDLPVDEPTEKPAEESHFMMRPSSRKFLREKDEQLRPCKGMMATIQEKYKGLADGLPTDFEARRLLLRQWRGLDN